MIMSGWILPDSHAVECKTCSVSRNHLEIVRIYFANLKQKDYSCYESVMLEFFKLRTQKKVSDIEEFAIVKLGWVKIIDQPIKAIFYSSESPLEIISQSYSQFGYHPIPIYHDESIINICVPSEILI